MIPMNMVDNTQMNDPIATPQGEVVTTPPNPVDEAEKAKTKRRNAEFLKRIDICRVYRRRLIANWNINIDYRRGKPFASQPDGDSVAVNLDWSMTKTKQAALFSQVPKVRVAHQPQSTTAGPWLASFENKLNDTLVLAGIESAMDEALPDCINAAGIGVSLVAYESMTEDKEVPTIDISTLPPELQMEVMQKQTLGGQPIPMETVPQVIAHRYVIQRVSPSDFLWPIDFTGSNFDNAPWIGRTGRVTWAEAVQRFNLKDEEKASLLGEDLTDAERLSYDVERDVLSPHDQRVGFDEIFYKDFVYDSNARSYYTIHHLVFVHGKDDPVIDEPWKGQQVQEGAPFPTGSSKYPVRVLSLAYITDDNIPPSDSAIGRPQVDELNKSRTQRLMQRERSLPVRWFDVNRLDNLVQQALMRGTWQHMIPVQGDGSRIIGQVAPAVYPKEDLTFDQIAKSDLAEAWTIGPNQIGSGADVETKGESSKIAEGFQTRIGRERAKVASYFTGIAEVLGGLICLYEDPQSFGEGFDPTVSQVLSYSILADSTVLLDSKQRLERLNQFVNMYAKSGWVNLEPVLKEVASLTGLDPNTVIRAPQPPPPEKPNISLRLTGTEDMMNPMTLAMVLGEGKPPTSELIEQAKVLIQQAVVAQPPQPPQAPPGPNGEPGGPAPLPPPAPVGVGEANPNMSSLPKITKRSNAPVEEQ